MVINLLPKSLLALVLGLTVVTGYSVNSAPKSIKPLEVTVSIFPQEYFVKKIAKEKVEVNVLVQQGNEPETYEPLPQQLKAVSQADAYITIGVALEKTWLDKIKSLNPDLVIINSGEGVPLIPMISHGHDHEHDHGEENLDPHIWLSPQRVKIQAQNIYQGLVQLDPANQAEYKQNLEQFIAEIDQLDQEIRKNLAPIQNRQFIVFHPAWGYFAKDYDLEQIPIEVGGQEPSAAELAELVKKTQTEGIKVIFAQYQFSARTAETIAREIDGEVKFIDPLAANWSENLLQVSQTFADVLQ